jgi:glycosyltransferase involved in cell wall biosynthesis
VQNRQRPAVSIVLPTWNGAAHIREAVDSCRLQTYQDWELIIVDDASTDATPAMVEEFVASDRRIFSRRHAENLRLPAALNTGFAFARGRYLTWTSDDNSYQPDAIAELVRFMESRPNIGIVYSDFVRVDEGGRVLDCVEVGEPEGLAIDNCIGPCFLYRREVHERCGGYCEEMYLAEDFDFWLRASREFKLAPFHRPLYCYRIHPGSLTAQKRDQVVASVDRTLARNLPLISWMAPAVRAKSFLHLARRAQIRHDWSAALKYGGRAFRLVSTPVENSPFRRLKIPQPPASGG